jgi:hypothetical protein
MASQRSGSGAGKSLAKIARIAKVGKAEFDVRNVLILEVESLVLLGVLGDLGERLSSSYLRRSPPFKPPSAAT